MLKSIVKDSALNNNQIKTIDTNKISKIAENQAIENYLKLMELMNYKHKKTKDSKDYYFTYQPQYDKNNKDKIIKKHNKNSPFDKLSELRFR